MFQIKLIIKFSDPEIQKDFKENKNLKDVNILSDKNNTNYLFDKNTYFNNRGNNFNKTDLKNLEKIIEINNSNSNININLNLNNSNFNKSEKTLQEVNNELNFATNTLNNKKQENPNFDSLENQYNLNKINNSNSNKNKDLILIINIKG